MVFPIPFLMNKKATKEKKKSLNYCNNAAPVHIIGIPAGKRQIIHLHFHLTRSEDQMNCDGVQLWVTRVKSALFLFSAVSIDLPSLELRGYLSTNFSFLQLRSNK